MLINDKIILDRYYCINSVQTKVHYILHPRNIFIRVKAFILMLVPGGLQLLIINTCCAWCPETSIKKYGVFTALAHVNCHNNTRFFFSLLIYAC